MFALVAAVVAAASAAGAPPRRLVTVGCDDAIKTAPPRSTMHTGGDNLTLGTLTLTRLARLADPVGFRRFRRGGLYRIPTYAVTTDEGAVTVAARGAAADATFAFGPKRVPAKAVTFVPCRSAGSFVSVSVFAGVVIVQKPGCYAFAMQLGGDVFRRTVPLGVARRCD